MVTTKAADRDASTDLLLAALADPTRRRIVELLAEAPRRAGQIHGAFAIADPAVSRHLRVLRDAGVVTVAREAGDERVRLYALEPGRLEGLAHWIAEVSNAWQAQLESFKGYVALRSASAPLAKR